MRWKSHVRFGGRAGETHPPKGGQGAPVRSHVANRASIRSAAACRTRPSAIVAASAIRSTGSASCCSPAANGSTNAARTGCCSACASATPTTSCSAPGWPRSPCATCTSPTHATDAATLLDKAIAGCAADEVAEVRSLGKTLASWRTEILAHHDTGASNGPTEGLNLCVKKVKRCGHGFRSFEQLPAARPAPRRRRHLAGTAPTTPDPNPHSPLRRVEPDMACFRRPARLVWSKRRWRWFGEG